MSKTKDSVEASQSFTKEQKLSYLMNTTGKSKIACDIALQLAGDDVDRAIERMKESYPESLQNLDIEQ